MANEYKHVKISVEDAIDTALSGSTSIWFPATEFDTKAVTEYCVVEPIAVVPLGASGTQVGTRRELVQMVISVYASVGVGGETTHRIYELADIARAAFDRTTLTVVNWSDAQQAEAYVYWPRGQLTPLPVSKNDQLWLAGLNLQWDGVLWA